MLMPAKIAKPFGVLLLVGGLYYVVRLLIQYDDIYRSWHNWAQPVFDFSTIGMLCLMYLIAVLTPILLVIAGITSMRHAELNGYLLIPLAALLLLSDIAGKLILLLIACLWALGRFQHASAT